MCVSREYSRGHLLASIMGHCYSFQSHPAFSVHQPVPAAAQYHCPQVVLAYPPQQRQLAAETLALYLHVYHGVSGQEAVEVRACVVGQLPLALARGCAQWLASSVVWPSRGTPPPRADPCPSDTSTVAAGGGRRHRLLPSAGHAALIPGGAGAAGGRLVPPCHAGLALRRRPRGDCGRGGCVRWWWWGGLASAGCPLRQPCQTPLAGVCCCGSTDTCASPSRLPHRSGRLGAARAHGV